MSSEVDEGDRAGVSFRRQGVRGEGERQPSGLLASGGGGDGEPRGRFNDEWVPDLTVEDVRERGRSGRAVMEELRAAGVVVFSDGGLDQSTAVGSVDLSSGSPVFTDGPFVETKEHLGGFAVVDVPDDDAARYWAGRIAVPRSEEEVLPEPAALTPTLVTLGSAGESGG